MTLQYSTDVLHKKTTMKRHTKLFEEFQQEPEETQGGKRYWIAYHHTDGQIFGLFDDEKQAMDAAEAELDSIATSEEDYEENEDIDYREVDLNDDDEVEDLFKCAFNWGDLDLVVQLIEIGADPMTFFTAEQLIDLFRDRMDMLPPDFRNLLSRSRKSNRLFGI